MNESILLIPLLSIATFFDIKTKKIPNYFNVFLLIFGIGFSMTINDISIVKSLLYLTGCFVISYPLYYINALGAGDVKLFIAISSFLALNNWLMLILISLFLAAIVFTVRLIILNELNFSEFHYYRYTHFILWAYFILLILFKK